MASPMVNIRVLIAGTGASYRISLPPSELTVANIQRHLAAAMPPSDQILLLGPPYKVPKDVSLQSEEVLQSLRLGDLEDDPSTQQAETTTESTVPQQGSPASAAAPTATQPAKNILSTTERSGARRLFLFSKQALSQTAPDPPLCSLEPKTLQLPSQPPGPSPLDMSFASTLEATGGHSTVSSTSPMSSPSSQSPLHQALVAYERQFMLALVQGRVLADGADIRLRACRQCVQEQAIMARALRAAVANLSDHFNGAARTRTQFSNTFQLTTSKHASLLGRFENPVLSDLQSIQLHPALIRIARASGRVMETLLDTVPVEPERAWAVQCQNSHQKLLTLFAELDTNFSALKSPAQRDDEARQDSTAEQEIQNLRVQVDSGQVKQIRDRQAQRLERLTQDHRQAMEIILRAVGGGNREQGQDQQQKQQQQAGDSGPAVQNAFGPLQEMSNASKDIIPSMIQDDGQLAQFMETVATSKTRAMKRMQQRLREVSIAQSSIQRVLSSVNVLKDALQQQSENMLHLEHVEQLAASYNQFLSEIRRRRAYGQAVLSSSTAMMERLASMRSDEVKAREKFLRGPARHLMPPFFEIFVPTLATPPPLFTPQLPAMVELDTMPDVGPADEVTATAQQETEDATMMPASTAGDQGVISTSASTLTAESALPAAAKLREDAKMSVEQQTKDETGGKGPSSDDQGQQALQQQQQQQQQPGQQEQQDQLIVSADENDNDLILGDGGDGDAGQRAAEDAERKTLAYENAVLRQALERMGGKTPRAYLEAAKKAQSSVMQGTDSTDTDKVTIAALEKELAEARAQAESAKTKLAELEKIGAQVGDSAKQALDDDRISHSSFSVGNIGLFMPTGRGSGGKRTYLAFHTNCPHRYLSTDNIPGSPDFVLGRIVYQEELVAGEAGTDANPYGLHVGTKFWVLTVEVLNSNNAPPSSK